MKSAVLIIDVQCAAFDQNPKPYEAEAVVQRINQVTRLARNKCIPVIFLQSEHPGFLDYNSESW